MTSYLHRLIFIPALICLLLNSCTDRDVNPGSPTDSEYKQYGTPFDKIPAAEDIVMYEVNLRAFSPGGNLQGVIDRLDHIASLGTNVIWLMPIHPTGEIKSVNSPYSVRDYKSVSNEYGSLQDLRKLTDAAHARGIAVIMDWVANHTSWDHSWISNKTWYTQDASGNIIHPPGTNWQDVADLNFSNQEMRAAMIDAMEYWIYEANIDGFRCDYADGVPYDFWQSAWKKLNAAPGRKLIYLAEGTRNDHFTAGFHLNFSWNWYSNIKDVFNGQPVSRIFNAHQSEYNQTPAGKHWLRFTTNHDESAWDATPVRLFNGIEGALAASVLTIFTGGVPLIYGSQEVGVLNNVPFFQKSTINWNQNPAMLQTYMKILQVYSAERVARSVQNTVYAHNDVACFKKVHNHEELLIIVNARNRNVTFNIPAALDNTSWNNALTSSGITLSGSLVLRPYEFYILKK